jgi:hypothetical protein
MADFARKGIVSHLLDAHGIDMDIDRNPLVTPAGPQTVDIGASWVNFINGNVATEPVEPLGNRFGDA